MKKTVLMGLLPDEINHELSLQPSFRGRQLFKWINSGAESFAEMTNLAVSLRSEISEHAIIYTSSVTNVLHDPDGTIKLQITLQDGLAVETVLLVDSRKRKTACVSCQAGCAMNCAFCQTGQLGLGRNLTAGEIIEQFFFLEKEAGQLDNIVFMGMGEPMMNLEAIRKSVIILTHPDGRALSQRRITLSTSGIIRGIYDLADKGPHLRLAVSLTTADPVLREKLMPVTKTNPLPELKKAIAYYSTKTGKRVTLEAALLSGVNTGYESAQQMIEFTNGLDVHLNLIPWNPVSNLPFKEPARDECDSFVLQLEKAGINVTLRTRRGRKIGGACGQLGKTIYRHLE
jgi:23S rRNA (adenine2503-C2)-methyltransferase